MSEDIDRLRNLRKIPKGLVTKLDTWINTRGHDANIHELEVRLSNLSNCEDQYAKCQAQLEEVDPNELDPELNDRAGFDEKVAVVKAKLLEYRTS